MTEIVTEVGVIEKVQENTNGDVKYLEIRDPYGFIYITTNLINGKKYLGQGAFNKNWRNYLGSGTVLKKAFKLYGRENFAKNIILICYSEDELNQAEYDLSVFLDVVASTDWYNVVYGGGAIRGYRFSEEQKKKMSESHKGKVLSEETKQKMSDAKKGHIMSEETRKKIGQKEKERLSVPENNPMFGKNPYANKTEEEMAALKQIWSANSSGENNGMYGKHHSEETKIKISERLKVSMKGDSNPFYGKRHSEATKEYLRKINLGKTISEEIKEVLREKFTGKNNPNAHPIYCYELDEYFWGRKDVADKYPLIPITNIRLACQNPNRTCGKHPITGESLHWKSITMEEYDNHIKEFN